MPKTTLYHITDTHYPKDQGLLEEWVDRIVNGDIEAPDAVIHSGDIVNGAEDLPELKLQLTEAKAILDQLPCPYYTCCHSHDRFGEPIQRAGQAYQEIFQQPYLQSLDFGDYTCHLVSGSITCDPAYQPEGYQNDPPSYGYCLYEEHVIRAAESTFNAAKGRSAYALMFYHLPIVPYRIQNTSTKDPHGKAAIGEEERARILALMDRLNIRASFGGHTHLNSYQKFEDKHFVVTTSFMNKPAGYRRLELGGNGRIAVSWHELDLKDFDYRGYGKDDLFGMKVSELEALDLYYRGTPEERDFVIQLS